MEAISKCEIHSRLYVMFLVRIYIYTYIYIYKYIYMRTLNPFANE